MPSIAYCPDTFHAVFYHPLRCRSSLTLSKVFFHFPCSLYQSVSNAFAGKLELSYLTIRHVQTTVTCLLLCPCWSPATVRNIKVLNLVLKLVYCTTRLILIYLYSYLCIFSGILRVRLSVSAQPEKTHLWTEPNTVTSYCNNNDIIRLTVQLHAKKLIK